MESVPMGDGVVVPLHNPMCELQFDGCNGKATAFYRVHTCASYYACFNCDSMMASRILQSFTRYQELSCTNCGMGYSLPAYVEVIPLGGAA